LLGVADPRSACDAGAEGAAGAEEAFGKHFGGGASERHQKRFFTVTYRD